VWLCGSILSFVLHVVFVWRGMSTCRHASPQVNTVQNSNMPTATQCQTLQLEHSTNVGWRLCRKMKLRVFEIHYTQSVAEHQREFRETLKNIPPTANSTRKSYETFVNTACICEGKNSDRQSVSVETIVLFWQACQRGRRKSACRVAVTWIFHSSVWQVWNRLVLGCKHCYT
jgi:hypothetical protein